MAPSAWDDEDASSSSESSAPVIGRRKFDDEEDEDILDSWDAAEDSEVEREKAKKAAEAEAKAKAEAAANKKSKAERIEEQRQARLKARLEADALNSDDDEDEAERRARLRATEQDADLAHATDLFDGIGINPNRSKAKAVVISDSSDPTQAVDLSAMPLFAPKTKDQFANLTSTLIPLLAANAKKPHYTIWLQEFSKQLVKELSSAEVKKIASALTTVSNEKMKAEKDAEKGGKKSKAAKNKASLVATRDVAFKADTTSYDDGLGDDDFM